MVVYPLRVGCAQPTDDDGLGQAIQKELETLGCQVTPFLYHQTLPDLLDLVLVYGPFASLVPVAKQLAATPEHDRPQFALWHTEPFPNPALPEWYRRAMGEARSRIDRGLVRQTASGEWKVKEEFSWLLSRGLRYRYYGDLFWLRNSRLLSVFATTSQWNAEFFRKRGFDVRTAYLGSYPEMGRDMQISRDIPVLWLGTISSDRRRQVLNQVRRELLLRGIDMVVVDGVEQPRLFGEERTVLLNRTKICLNLMRYPWDDSSLRFYLAGRNKAMIVTEPILPHTPFSHRKHLVEVPADQIAETISYYLAHEDERRSIAEQAFALVTTELTMQNALRLILDNVDAIQKAQQ